MVLIVTLRPVVRVGLWALLLFASACAKKSESPAGPPEGGVISAPAAPRHLSQAPSVDAPSVDARSAVDGCTVENRTSRAIDLVDTAIELPLGKVAPGASGTVGGHFAARAEGLGTARGYCATGSRLTVVERRGRLEVVGEGTNEGVGE